MASHVFRPLYVVAGLATIGLIAAHLAVPPDFGVGPTGYMYGWHRKGNEAEWKALKPKYRTAAYCKDCHAEQHGMIARSPHTSINCENCHGPAQDHPVKPAKLTINRDRALCLRCHYALPYSTSGRAMIRGIDPEKHNPGVACADCHNPHLPNQGGAR